MSQQQKEPQQVVTSQQPQQQRGISLVDQKIRIVKDLLAKMKAEIATALPRHMTPDRMIRVVTTEVRKNPALLECDPTSLMGAVIQASQLGLEIGGELGHCYFVPFHNKRRGCKEVQFIPGYRGMMELARRAGTTVIARAVYDGDEFNYAYGMEDILRHVPSGESDPAKLTHVYAVGRTKDDVKMFVVLTRKQIEESKKRSKAAAYGSSPWDTDYEAMAMKTAIRRLFKFLPSSIEVQRAAGFDEQAEAGVSQGNREILDVESEVEGQKSSLADRVQAAKAQQSEPGAFDSFNGLNGEGEEN